MKILVALSRFPYPIDKGDKLRAFYQIQGLSKYHEVHLVCIADKTPSPAEFNEVKQYCKSIEVIESRKLKRLINLGFGLFNNLPFQVNYFKSSRMKRAIEKVLKTQSIDMCYVQLVRLVVNIPFSLNTKYYLDYMDALSEGMYKRVKFSRWYEKPVVKLEAKRLRDFEAKAFFYFNGYSIITESDATAFPSDIKKRMDIIPNGISSGFFNFRSFPKDKSYDIIFTGNMGYHPNIQASKYLVNQIMPLLNKQDVKICLSGTSPSIEVQNLESENVIVTGFVHDIRDYLAKAKIFVAPLFSGSGLQNKLLEAMAMGIPTITTSLANSALGAKPGQEIMVCDDEESFVKAIQQLLSNPEYAREIGAKGRLFIQKNFNWEVSNDMLEKAFRKILN
ncbi:glycosyltransferase [Sporocytophaga myxococcoides]|uniref:glycosyltransferase n=1 Tax=Sporocytophaga myxococcoides TaxID=153721 RepID=UPI0004163351|nr:glycosyltransferase [Sporocytophaga myxococcoides]